MRQYSVLFDAPKFKNPQRKQANNIPTPVSATVLVLETGEGSYSRFHPSLLIGTPCIVDEVRPVRGQVYPHDEVRRVTGR